MASFLYPPIIPSYIPAFVKGSEISLPFSVSPYESRGKDIKAVHISVQEQNTNFSVVGSESNSFNLIEVKIGGQTSGVIKIQPSKVALKTNTFYKVQMRFCTSATQENEIFNISWIDKHLSDCSEWSSVCLIKPISKPDLIIEDNWTPGGFDVNTKKIANNTITGYLSFDERETEYLKSYQMKLYQGSKLLEDSGRILSGIFNPNALSFEYHVDLSTSNNVKYKLVVNYVTINGYEETLQYFFNVEKTLGTEPEIHWFVTSLSNEGALQLTFLEYTDNTDTNIIGNYMISRSSIEDNYTKWEDIHLFSIGPEEVKNAVIKEEGDKTTKILYEWKDYSVFPAVLYQYAVQTIFIDEYNKEHRGQRKIVDNSVSLINIEDIFLFDGQNNLKIRFNPNISSFKKTILESKTDTLGSPYPFIRRNGDVEYKQFQLSGLISYHMDEETIFQIANGSSNECDYRLPIETIENSSFVKDLFQGDPSIITSLSIKNGFDKEIYIERKFRERVMNFLYADNVKLFKSETEGIMLIRLMDISLTPETQLGRKIYSFSATAYEVAAPTFNNLKKYGLLKLDNYKDVGSMAAYDVRIGQIKIGGFDAAGRTSENRNVIEEIRATVKAKDTKLTYEFNSLYFIRFTFVNPPRNIDNKYYGHQLTINGENFAILNGVYQITDDDMDLKEATFIIAEKDEVIVDFIYKEINKINLDTFKNFIYTENIVGQVWEVCNAKWNKDEDILRAARAQYEYEKDNIYKIVTGIKAIGIESLPGTVFRIKDITDAERDSESRGEIHIMNNTGKMFYFNDEKNVVSALYCEGIRLVPTFEDSNITDDAYYSGQNNKIRGVQEWEYQVNKNTYLSLDEVPYPMANTVYQISLGNNNNEYWINYNNTWYLLNNFNNQTLQPIILDIPVDVLVDYYFSVSTGTTNLYEGISAEGGN